LSFQIRTNLPWQDQTSINPSVSFSELKQAVKDAVSEEVERCLRLWSSAGRAAEVLTQCELWLAVEQAIIYNAIEDDKHPASMSISQGQQLLSNIPGVRKVFTGKATKNTEKNTICWFIQLSNKSVIKSFSEHPDFIQFSKNITHQSCFDDAINKFYVDIS